MITRERLRRLAGDLLFPFLVPFALRRMTRPYMALQASMLPTIRPGDRVTVLLLEHCGPEPIARGDLVVFESWHEGEEAALKRVIACPGEEIAIHGHTILVDGVALDEPYAVPPTHGVVPPTRLGAGEYFVMGDNRSQSCDSRRHGALTHERLIGRAFFRFWPPTRIGYLE